MLDVRELEAPDGFSCRGVRDPKGRDLPGWFLFISDDTDTRWLCVATAPAGLELNGIAILGPGQEDLTAKLIALLGMPWAELEDHFFAITHWQSRCQGSLGERVARALDGATIEDINGWREQIEARDPGELIRAWFTRDDPRAVSN